MPYLKRVQYQLPFNDKRFVSDLFNYFSPLGKISDDWIVLTQSRENFVPITSIFFRDVTVPLVGFLFSDETSINVELVNTTATVKSSTHKYLPISLQEFLKRIAPFPLKCIDHTGFNLPYFDGVHPIITNLRNGLKKACLYHTFPKHLADAPWDFILPGSVEEINQDVKTDYSAVRRPKLEIVSFDKSSTPLIQIDIKLVGKYEEWIELFPEGIHEPYIRCVWVYIKNKFGIDFCLVLNEHVENDWSVEFANDRLF